MADVSNNDPRHRRPVFLDLSGRRWTLVRRSALWLGVVASVLVAIVVLGILSPPRLPTAAAAAVTHAARRSRWPATRPAVALTRPERARLTARRRLFAALESEPTSLGVRATLLPGQPIEPSTNSARTRGPEIAGFYVNWDDNSLASLRAHARALDFVVCEWAFVMPTGDSLRLAIDPRVLLVARRLPAAERPRVLAMVSNVDPAGDHFDPGRLRRLLQSDVARAKAVAQLASAVRTFGLGGVTVDFEEVPDDLHSRVVRFMAELRGALGPSGALVTQAIPADLPPAYLRELATLNDRLFLMLYDEHYAQGDPGPVASQSWYTRKARETVGIVPAGKVILGVGAYGYDWNDAGPDASGDEMTFHDVMTTARNRGARARFDPVSLTPYVAWTDPDSTDHIVWYLDGVTAYNQILAGRALGVAGHAVWRLGSEDPSLWRLLTSSGLDVNANRLAEIPPGYDIEFQGEGEILRLSARPTSGRRELRVDPRSKLIVDERLSTYPTPFVVERAGAVSAKVALTFDDGPDDSWTPAILDTLRRYGARATFFVIGQNVESNIPLTQRILREGHEVGNHTFTHPNLALTSRFVTRLEINATQRVLEAALNRRSVLFRPPYFGDAEPTTGDELVPVGIASDLGYITIGVHVDSDDWQQPGADQIVRNVLARRSLGNVVLLHDGGGNRRQTVAALGPLIDSLRARGDTLVPLSELMGVQRSHVMPGLPAASATTRLAELASYGVIGLTEWGLHWLLLVAAALGVGRLVLITGLALVQRFRRRRAAATPFAPAVSVIVPAYNEAKVIERTITSLLGQQYPGELEVLVVDDGSPDHTDMAASRAFCREPRVAVYRKPNGGKASALNFGIERARGEIVVGLDADTIFLPNTIARLVAPLADPRVGAVAGNAKVGNRTNLVTRWQALEYVTSQNLDRRAFALLDCITVVPGAIGAWRKELVQEVGGFSDDTLAEDQDLTLAIRRRGHAIAYADDAVAYTEAPDTFRGLAKQRFRWSFGTLQCMWKHRDVLLRRRYGTLGLFAMPNVWLFQLVFAALSPLADLMFLWSLLSVWLTRLEHGATYALISLEQLLTLYAVFLFVDWSAAAIAFLLEPGEDKRLTWLIVLQRFAYRQIMYWVVAKAFVAAIRGHVVGWGKLERKGTVGVPASADQVTA
jgi:cellulose synthase/poly-beta-1,6-N-acetylglucosamine synthase-like glycosyltransferase/peptidoglycan/xylan/chitin deacetylase (PgdA/CDA1 family)/spore germination protein YaaH